MEETSQIAQLLLTRYGLRLEPEMCRYVLKQLQLTPAKPSIPIIGGDARTGVAVRQLLATDEMRAAIRASGA
jgi:hypothetical protein